MTSDKLPAVLTFQGKQASISMERALKQAKGLLEQFACGDDCPHEDVQASLDDLELMIKAIER